VSEACIGEPEKRREKWRRQNGGRGARVSQRKPRGSSEDKEERARGVVTLTGSSRSARACSGKKTNKGQRGDRLDQAKDGLVTRKSGLLASLLFLLIFFYLFLQNNFRKKQERDLERVQNMFQQIKFKNFIFI
jgi:hypothetical protein